MDNLTPLSTHLFVRNEQYSHQSEYTLRNVINGKCLLPLKIRVNWLLGDQNNISIQFFDSPDWQRCKSFELLRCSTTSKVFMAERSILKWSTPLILQFSEDLKSIRIIILRSNKHQSF